MAESTQTKAALVPELRFSEFEGKWLKIRLDDLAKIERGRFSPRPRNNPIYYGGDIPFVQTGDVVNSNGVINTFSQTLNQKGLKVSKLFNKGTILITIAANIGYSGILEVDMACPDSLVGLSCMPIVNNKFLNYLLHIEQPRMDYMAVSAAQKNINVEFLKPYNFNLPKLAEQEKIASFLTRVDQRIALLQSKKEQLDLYKKGVMQQLFSQELRFKDANGQDFPEWEEKRLGEVATFSKGKGLSKSDIKEKGEFKCIHYGELFTKYKELINEVLSKTDIQSNVVLSIKNDVLMPTSDVTPNGLATASCIVEDNIIIGGDVLIIRQKQRVLNGLFLAYYITHHKNKVMKLVSGSTVYHIYGSDMKKFIINYPSIEEQQKIASFLGGLDAGIEKVGEQIAQTQAWKKGLLQRMFV